MKIGKLFIGWRDMTPEQQASDIAVLKEKSRAAGSYANVQVTFQQAADGTPFTMESYSFQRPDNAGVTVADAYTLLKTLPEYADAVCV